MSTLAFIVLILVLFSVISKSGIGGALRMLPIILFFFILIYLIGYFFVPILIIGLIWYFIRSLSGGNKRTYTYYSWNDTNSENFEDFFRNAGGNFGGGYQDHSGYSNNNSNPFGYQEDKSKYYSILGVSENATQDEIKRAYRNLVKEHHPDKFANDPAAKEYHENKLKEINEAYEKISKN